MAHPATASCYPLDAVIHPPANQVMLALSNTMTRRVQQGQLSVTRGTMCPVRTCIFAASQLWSMYAAARQSTAFTTANGFLYVCTGLHRHVASTCASSLVLAVQQWNIAIHQL